MAGGGGEYQCGPGQWGRSHAVNSLGARGGAEQRCCHGERSGAGLRAPRSPCPPRPRCLGPARHGGGRGRERPAFYLYFRQLDAARGAARRHAPRKRLARGRGWQGGYRTERSGPGLSPVGVWGAGRLPAVGGRPGGGAAQPEWCRPVGRVGGSRRPEREARAAVLGRRVPP